MKVRGYETLCLAVCPAHGSENNNEQCFFGVRRNHLGILRKYRLCAAGSGSCISNKPQKMAVLGICVILDNKKVKTPHKPNHGLQPLRGQATFLPNPANLPSLGPCPSPSLASRKSVLHQLGSGLPWLLGQKNHTLSSKDTYHL